MIQPTTVPQRRHEAKIEIDADTWEDVILAIKHVLFVAEADGVEHNLVSGGYTSGIIFNSSFHPEITHDSYVESLNVWLESRKQKIEE